MSGLKRNRLIKLIHIGKKELGLEDDEYRGILFAVCAKVSSSLQSLSVKQAREVILALCGMMVKAGFDPDARRGDI